ncbi:MAG: hypothetical protein AABW68_03145 [archaeon]
MALFTPIADAGMALVFILGSVSIGYTGARWIYPPLVSWKGWRRVGVGSLLGVAWSVSVIGVFIPAADGISFPLPSFVEFFGFMALGFLFLMGIATFSWWITHRVLVHGMMIPSPARTSFNGEMEEDATSSLDKNSTFPVKPIASRSFSGTKNPAPVMEDPVVENDFLSLLKEENTGKRSNAPIPKTPPPAVSPMSQLDDFAGFEDTLAQLKRDLKDFNENMNQTRTRRG